LSRFFFHGLFDQNSLNLASFAFSFGVRVCLASVAVDDVRDVINVGSSEVSDSKIAKMIKRAEVTLELETDKEIDYSNCSGAEKSTWKTQGISCI